MKKIFIFLIVLLFIFSLIACSSIRFDGNRTGNDNEFIMDFKVLNITDHQMLKLEQGDTVEVEVVIDSGTLNVEVLNDDNELVYRGNDIPTSSFKIDILESGTYIVKPL